MSTGGIQKKKIQRKRAQKITLPAISYSLTESASEQEIQSALDKAFDILFSETLKNVN